tara:strand:- start:677 stop:1741 length:1065 start_codon:yes stop_codon:yes gene_type:complete
MSKASKKERQERRARKLQRKWYSPKNLLVGAAGLALLGALYFRASSNSPQIVKQDVTPITTTTIQPNRDITTRKREEIPTIIDVVKQHATIEHVNSVNDSKPYFMLVLQYHKGGDGRLPLTSLACQVDIANIFIDLIDNKYFGRAHIEGGYDSISFPSDIIKNLFINPKNHNSDFYETVFRTSLGLNAHHIAISVTGSQEFYGMHSEETKKIAKDFDPLERDAMITRFIKGKKAGSLTLTLKDAKKYVELAQKVLDVFDAYSHDAVFTVYKRAQVTPKKNVVSVIGYDHGHDFRRFDKEGKLDELKKQYNVCYVIPNTFLNAGKLHGTKEHMNFIIETYNSMVKDKIDIKILKF